MMDIILLIAGCAEIQFNGLMEMKNLDFVVCAEQWWKMGKEKEMILDKKTLNSTPPMEEFWGDKWEEIRLKGKL